MKHRCALSIAAKARLLDFEVVVKKFLTSGYRKRQTKFDLHAQPRILELSMASWCRLEKTSFIQSLVEEPDPGARHQKKTISVYLFSKTNYGYPTRYRNYKAHVPNRIGILLTVGGEEPASNGLDIFMVYLKRDFRTKKRMCIPWYLCQTLFHHPRAAYLSGYS